MSVADRLRDARIALGLTQAVVAKRVGISPALVSHHETSEREPGNEHLVAYARLYKCSTDWLLTGRGQAPDAQSAEIVEIFERVDKRDRARVLRILRSFTEDNGNS